MKSFPILGIRIDELSRSAIIQKLRAWMTSGTYHSITTVNAEIIMHAYRNPDFAEVLNRSSLNIIDGSGPEFFARFVLHKKVRRLPGVDLIDEVMTLAAEEHMRVTLLGGREMKQGKYAAEIVAAQYVEKYPDLRLMTEQGGEMEVQDEKLQMEQGRRERIAAFAPDIILLASRNPIQEHIVSVLGREFPSARIGIGIGGAFNMKAGILRRAPKIFRTLGLEWLWRLLLEPHRVKRIITAVIIFPLTALYRMIVPRLRPNVVMCVVNSAGNILLAERKGEKNHWQFPQGGIEIGETLHDALSKELQEEVHITKSDIASVSIAPQTHTYTWSKEYLQKFYRGPFQGQKQTIAIVRYTGPDEITVDQREFSNYIWVAPAQLLEKMHPVRHAVAKIALAAL